VNAQATKELAKWGPRNGSAFAKAYIDNEVACHKAVNSAPVIVAGLLPTAIGTAADEYQCRCEDEVRPAIDQLHGGDVISGATVKYSTRLRPRATPVSMSICRPSRRYA